MTKRQKKKYGFRFHINFNSYFNFATTSDQFEYSNMKKEKVEHVRMNHHGPLISTASACVHHTAQTDCDYDYIKDYTNNNKIQTAGTMSEDFSESDFY